MAIVRIRARRQVTIPKEIFDRLGLHEGDFVEVTCNKDRIVLEPVDPDDVLMPEEEKLVEKGFAQIRRGEYVTWEELYESSHSLRHAPRSDQARPSVERASEIF